MSGDLTSLVDGLPDRLLDDADLLREVGRRLGIDWPADYLTMISQHNGVEGDVGKFALVLTAVEELVEANGATVAAMFPDLVLLGGDGGGEALAIHRHTGQLLLVPWIGAREDWLLLGDTVTNGLRTLAEGRAFSSPRPFGST